MLTQLFRRVVLKSPLFTVVDGMSGILSPIGMESADKRMTEAPLRKKICLMDWENVEKSLLAHV